MVSSLYATNPQGFMKRGRQGLSLAQMKSESKALRYQLTFSGVEWEEVPGCYPWLQAEVKPDEFLEILMKYKIIDADLLE
jgi:hypothetical protein